ETCAVQVAATATYSGKVPVALREEPVLQAHASRACRIQELLFQNPKVGADDLAAIMGDHGPTGGPDGASPCVHTGYFNTTATLQWFPARRSLRVSYSPTCKAQYVEFAL